MNIKNSIFLLGLSILVSCKKEDLQTNIININDEIEVFVNQKPTAAGISPVLQITTVDSVSCSNTELWVESNISTQLIEIDILGVLLNGSCIQGNFKPMTEVELNGISGKYDLTFDLKNAIQSKGKLEITSDKICLSMTEETGVVAGHQCIQRLHPNAIWGYIQAKETADIVKFNQFLQGLSYLTFMGTPGNYGVFTMTENRQIQLTKTTIDLSLLPNVQQLYFQAEDLNRFISDLDLYLHNNNGYKLELSAFNGTNIKR